MTILEEIHFLKSMEVDFMKCYVQRQNNRNYN